MTQPQHRRRWRTIRVAQPAAGSDWALVPDGGATWRVTSLVARLVTSGAAANRRVTFRATDGERTWFAEPTSADQIATQTVDYCAHTGATRGGVVPGVLVVPLPRAGLLLRAGHRLTVSTAAIDAGDQWSVITAVVDETLSSRQVIGDATDEAPLDTVE